MANGVPVEGVTYNNNGTIILPESIVRLYNAENGLLEDETISSGSNEYQFSRGRYGFGVAPQKFYVVGYHPNDGKASVVPGSHTGSVLPETVNYQIPGEITDSGVDLFKIKLPNIANLEVHYFGIESYLPNEQIARFDLRDAPNGGGNAMVLNMLVGQSSAYVVGNFTTADYFYFRSVQPGKAILNSTVILWYTYA